MADNLSYKGRPLVRCNNELFYGNPTDDYVVFLQILSNKDVDGVEVADKVHVQLISTDTTKAASSRILKQSEKNGLYNALDIGDIWLKGAESGKI